MKAPEDSPLGVNVQYGGAHNRAGDGGRTPEKKSSIKL